MKQTNLFDLASFKIECVEKPMIKTHGNTHRIWLYNYKKVEWAYESLNDPECIFNKGLDYKKDADRWYKWRYTKKRYNEMLLNIKSHIK